MPDRDTQGHFLPNNSYARLGGKTRMAQLSPAARRKLAQ